MANPGLDSLIEYWPMNEASGNALGAHDGKNLGDFNTVTSDTGHVYPLARKFTPANSEYLRSGWDNELCIDTDWTIWFWCKLASQGPTATDYRGVFQIDLNFPGGIDIKFAYNDRIAIGVKQDGARDYIHTDHGGAAIGAWSFWCAWYDSTNEILYGEYNNDGTVDSGAADKPNPYTHYLYVGGKSTQDYFDGLIGPMCYHNAILTNAERDEIYNDGDGLTYEALTAENPAGYNKVDLSLGIRL